MFKEIIKKSNNPLIGIISSNYQGEDMKPYKTGIFNYFNQGGGIVYVCFKNNKRQAIDYLTKRWDLDVHRLYNKGQILFMCREDFFNDEPMNNYTIVQKLTEDLNRLSVKGIKEKYVYIIVDSFWDDFFDGKFQDIYIMLSKLYKNGSTNIVLRYLIEELKEGHIDIILNNHDYLLVDGIEDFEVYRPNELIYQSINIMSKHNVIRKIYEKEMMRVEYLRTLGELMEGTVHDINNLLITILGYAQLSMSVEDKKEIEDYLGIIHRTAMDGKAITDRIQHHIRGSYDSLKDIYKFNSIINSCIDMTKHKFKPTGNRNSNLELTTDLQSNGFIYANEYEIRQAIINIILNGIDAMDRNGKMLIRTYDIGNQVVLEISDTGKGMDENTKDMIFKPYFTTKGDMGTGLGLHIAKRIFDNHRAKVLVDSELGQGTKFTIFFPMEEKIYSIAQLKDEGYNIN